MDSESSRRQWRWGGHWAGCCSFYDVSVSVAVDLITGEGINERGEEGDIDVVRYGVIQFCRRRESHRCGHWDSPDVMVGVSTTIYSTTQRYRSSSVSRLSPDNTQQTLVRRWFACPYRVIRPTNTLEDIRGRMNRCVACRTTASLAATGVVG